MSAGQEAAEAEDSQVEGGAGTIREKAALHLSHWSKRSVGVAWMKTAGDVLERGPGERREDEEEDDNEEEARGIEAVEDGKSF